VIASASHGVARGVAINLAKARDMLARIVKGRDHGKRPVEVAVSRTPFLGALAADRRDSRLRVLIGKKHGAVQTQPAVTRPRPADSSKLRLRKAERSGKAAKPRQAG